MIDDPKTKDQGSAGGQASQDIQDTSEKGNLGEFGNTEQSDTDTNDDMTQ